MKRLLYTTLFLSTLMTYAQVGINTDTPNANSALDIRGNNQGIIVPKIALSSRTTTNQFAVTPQESLLFYNTNENVAGGKAFYFWNGNRWDFVFNDTNINMVENLIGYESADTTNSYQSNTYNSDTHNIGDNLDSTWTELVDLRQTVNITRPVNSLLFTTSGMIQADNGSTNGIAQILLGIFVDDKLTSINPLYFKVEGACAYRSFKVVGTTKNPLTIGTKNIKVAFKNLTKSYSSNINISYGKSFSTCNNLSDTEAKISSTTLLNQPFNF